MASRRIGPYEVTGTLGQGGMGTVLRARAPDGREVAIKVLNDAHAGAFDRFERERALMAALGGEEAGLVPCLDAGRDERGPFIVMPLVPGGTLRDRLRARPQLELEEALRVARALARALAPLHARDVVHRDVKPENVLFTADDRPLLGDLGLAKVHDQRLAALSRTGEFRGTVGYMAPEQMRDAKRVGPAADVFALGCLLHECLAGVPPFEGDGPLQVLAMIERGGHTPIGELRPDLPPWVARAIDHALVTDPASRPADAAAWLRLLEPPRARTRRRGGHATALRLLAGAAALVALVAAGAVAWRRPAPAPAPVPVPAATPVPAPAPPPPPATQPEAPAAWRLAPRPPWGQRHARHEAMVDHVSLSPDGQRVASAGLEQEVRVWSAVTGEELAGLAVPSVPVACDFTPDGGALLLAGAVGERGWLWVWSPGSGQARELPAQDGPGLTCAVPLDDGALTADAAGAVVRRDAAGRRVWSTPGAGTRCAASADGEVVVAADDRALRLLDGRTGQVLGDVRTGAPSAPLALDVAAHGRRAALAHADGTVSLWRLAPPARERVIVAVPPEANRAYGYCRAARLDRGGERLLTVGDDDLLRCFDASSGAELFRLAGHRGWISDVAVSPDGRRAVTGGNDQTVRLWDLEARAEAWPRLGHDSKVQAVSWSSAGVYSAGHDGSVRAWDAETGREVGRLEADGPVTHLHVAADGAVAALTPGGLLVWPSTGDPARLSVRGVERLALLDDRWLVWCDAAGALQAARLEPGTAQQTRLEHGVPIRALLPRDEAALLVRADGSVTRVVPARREVEQVLAPQGLAVTCAALARDGALVVACDDEGGAHVLDLATPGPRRSFALTRPAIAVAVAPDGSWAVTSEADRALRLWRLPDGRLLDTLDLRPTGELGLALDAAPDGGAVVVGSSRTVVLRVDVVPR